MERSHELVAGDGPCVVQLGDLLLVVPGQDPQCVARTLHGHRCRHGINHQRGRFLEQHDTALLWSSRGVLPVHQVPNTHAELQVWTRQRCPDHENGGSDHCPAEWHRFDPGHDARLIQAFPPWPRMPRPPEEWSPASCELTHLWDLGWRQHRQGSSTFTQGWDLEPPSPEPEAVPDEASLRWIDVCPHLGNAEKTLLRVLEGLTNGRTSCEVVLEDLRTRLFSGPVEVGQEPKTVSASGLLRLLRNLAGTGHRPPQHLCGP